MFLSRAPEFCGLQGWISSKPLTLKELRGKVVLLDFWTYSCVNCLRTLPHLKALYQKYKKYGFILIGVHTPEFDFERVAENVKKAVHKHAIPYPVALDSSNSTWKAYGNQYWPRQALIDAKGRVVWEHTGEGGYRELEEWIQKLLELAGKKVKEKVAEKDRDVKGYFSMIGISPEIYAGSLRNERLGSSGVCGAEGVCRFLDNSKKHERDVLYPQGEWIQRREELIHTGTRGYVLLKYRAREVNAVLDGKTTVKILLDNKKSRTIKINGPDIYNLVETKSQEEHEVKLVPKGRLAVYAFTFG